MHMIFKNSVHVTVITASRIQMEYYTQTQHFHICHPTVNILAQQTTIRHYFTIIKKPQLHLQYAFLDSKISIATNIFKIYMF